MRLLLLISLLYSQVCFSQSVVRNTVAQDDFGNVTCKKKQEIKGSDTSYYYSLAFRNLEYDYIKDYGAIILSSSADVNKFIADLKTIGTSINETSIKADKYRLSMVNDQVFMSDEDEKFTTLKQKDIDDIIAWFGKN